MLPLVFADNFQTAAVLTLVLPLGLLVVIAIWYLAVFRRVSETPRSSPAPPSPAVVRAAGDDVDQVQPAGPPPGEIV